MIKVVEEDWYTRVLEGETEEDKEVLRQFRERLGDTRFDHNFTLDDRGRLTINLS